MLVKGTPDILGNYLESTRSDVTNYGVITRGNAISVNRVCSSWNVIWCKISNNSVNVMFINLVLVAIYLIYSIYCVVELL